MIHWNVCVYLEDVYTMCPFNNIHNVQKCLSAKWKSKSKLCHMPIVNDWFSISISSQSG